MLVGHSFGEMSSFNFDGDIWPEARALVAA